MLAVLVLSLVFFIDEAISTGAVGAGIGCSRCKVALGSTELSLLVRYVARAQALMQYSLWCSNSTVEMSGCGSRVAGLGYEFGTGASSRCLYSRGPCSTQLLMKALEQRQRC